MLFIWFYKDYNAETYQPRCISKQSGNFRKEISDGRKNNITAIIRFLPGIFGANYIWQGSDNSVC